MSLKAFKSKIAKGTHSPDDVRFEVSKVLLIADLAEYLTGA